MGGDGAIGILWVEARDDAKHPTIYRTISQNKKITWPIMRRLRNPASDKFHEIKYCIDIKICFQRLITKRNVLKTFY